MSDKLSLTVKYLKIMQNHIIAKLRNYVKLHIVGKTCQITYEKKNPSNYRGKNSIKNNINKNSPDFN